MCKSLRDKDFIQGRIELVISDQVRVCIENSYELPLGCKVMVLQIFCGLQDLISFDV